MRKKAILTLATLGFMQMLHAQTHASATANQNAKLVLSNAIQITFTNSGGGEDDDYNEDNSNHGSRVTIPFTSVANYASGVISAAQNLKVQSNKNFNVTVRSSTQKFTYSGPYTNPNADISSVLSLLVTSNSTGGSVASGNYQGIQTSSQSLISNCTRGGNQSFAVKYKANPGFALPGGTYTANVIYTATQL